MFKYTKEKITQLGRRGSRNFSRGGGGADFRKNFENLVDFFFMSTKLIIWALPKHYKEPNLTKFSAQQKILNFVKQKKSFYQKKRKVLCSCSCSFFLKEFL